jgi:hypothetical protein
MWERDENEPDRTYYENTYKYVPKLIVDCAESSRVNKNGIRLVDRGMKHSLDSQAEWITRASCNIDKDNDCPCIVAHHQTLASMRNETYNAICCFNDEAISHFLWLAPKWATIPGMTLA